MKKILFLVLLASNATFYVKAQEAAVVPERSIEVIKRGSALKDEQKYEEAIKELRKVHRNDSNYYLASIEVLGSLLGAKKNEEGLALCDELLKLKNEYTPNILIFKADFLDNLERREEASKIFEAGAKTYPLNHLFYYESAVSKINQKKRDEAYDLIVKALYINPFHASSHRQMAVMAYRNNNLTAAMLAAQFYLVCDQSSNRAKGIVGDLEKMAKLELETDSIWTQKQFETGNDFSEMESILKSKFAFTSKFKTKTDMNYEMVKQMQLLIDNIGKYSTVTGFYNEYYGKYFAALAKTGYIEEYLYYSLKGMEIEKVNNWLAKNKSSVSKFEIWTYNFICTELANFPEKLDNTMTTVPHWYGESGISSAGKKNEKQNNTGYWNYYYWNGIKKSEGSFNDGEKQGTWKYYYNNGEIKEESTFDKGVQKTYKSYYTNNNPKVELSIEGDKIAGERKSYYSNGNLYSSTPYVQGEIKGTQKYYYRNGALRYSILNEKDIISGDLKEYFDNGKVAQTVKFVNSNREGLSKEFHNNNENTVEHEGTYVKNNRVGEWKTYYRSGKLLRVRNFNDNGELNGSYKEYYENGQLESEDIYSNDKLNGLCTVFTEDGKLAQEYLYKKGKLLEYRAYKNDGTKICDNKISGKKFSLVLYRPNGAKRREGAINDGDLHGIWKDYNEHGVLIRETNYDKGRISGKYKEYFNDGKIQLERTYVDGTENGPYKSYFANGKLKSEGEVLNGSYNGYWNNYYRDGKLESRLYYADGELDGWGEFYDGRGVINREELNKEGCIIKVVYHDTTGKVLQNIDLPGGNGLLEKKTAEGNSIYKRAFVKDLPEGESTQHYPDKVLQSKVEFKSGRREGKYVEYNAFGTLVKETIFFHNDRNGPEKAYYDDGKIQSVFNYDDDEFHGVCTTYFNNGKVCKYIRYNYGVTEGESDLFDELGELVYKRYFKGGLLVGYTYYGTDGKLLPIKEVAGDTKITCFFKNGKKSLEASYKNGDLHGKRVIYNSTGTVRDESEFNLDEFHGVSKEYYINGTLKATENYYFGVLHGTCQTYHENGKLQSEKVYVHGDLNGWHKMYDKTGKLLKSVLYHDGFPIAVR